MRYTIRYGLATLLAYSLSLHAPFAQAEDSPLAVEFQEMIEQLNEQGLFFEEGAAREAVFAALLKAADPQGERFSAEEWAEVLARQNGAVYDAGLELGISNEQVVVTALLPDTPAATANLAVGDRLLWVDDMETQGWDLYRIHQKLVRFEPLPLRVVTSNSEGAVVTQDLARVERILPGVARTKELPFSIAYLRLNGLFKDTGRAVAEQLAQWADEGQYGVILDLRGAEGLDLESVRAIGSRFAEPGTLLAVFRDKNDQDIDTLYADETPPLGIPVMVLLDERTAGAAEVLAAVLENSVRGAMLFGRPSRGDMMVREGLPMDDGRIMYMATRRLVTADGTIYDGRTGVRPDVIIARIDAPPEPPAPRIMIGKQKALLDEEIEQNKLHQFIRSDSALRRAADVLLGLKALNIRPIQPSP